MNAQAGTMGLFERVVLAVCPPCGRDWVEAAWAESGQVSSRPERVRWFLGLGAVAAAVVRVAAMSVSTRTRAVLAALLMGWVATGACTAAGFEGLRLDDDVYLVLSAGSAATFMAVGVFALHRSTPGRANANY